MCGRRCAERKVLTCPECEVVLIWSRTFNTWKLSLNLTSFVWNVLCWIWDLTAKFGSKMVNGGSVHNWHTAQDIVKHWVNSDDVLQKLVASDMRLWNWGGGSGCHSGSPLWKLLSAPLAKECKMWSPGGDCRRILHYMGDTSLHGFIFWVLKHIHFSKEEEFLKYSWVFYTIQSSTWWQGEQSRE